MDNKMTNEASKIIDLHCKRAWKQIANILRRMSQEDVSEEESDLLQEEGRSLLYQMQMVDKAINQP